jgi:hypothetical protein
MTTVMFPRVRRCRCVTSAFALPVFVDTTLEAARSSRSQCHATAFSTRASEPSYLVGPAERSGERAHEHAAAVAEHVVVNRTVEPGRLGYRVERLAEDTGAAAR